MTSTELRAELIATLKDLIACQKELWGTDADCVTDNLERLQQLEQGEIAGSRWGTLADGISWGDQK